MTTDEKIGYVQGFIRMIEKADDHNTANIHAFFLRGILSAWNVDASISHGQYNDFYNQIDILMQEKRKLSVYEKEPF